MSEGAEKVDWKKSEGAEKVDWKKAAWAACMTSDKHFRKAQQLEIENEALKRERAMLVEAVKAYQFAYTPDGHSAPHDCFSTGPLTGSMIAEYVACPGCSAEQLGDKALSATEQQSQQWLAEEKANALELAGEDWDNQAHHSASTIRTALRRMAQDLRLAASKRKEQV